MTFFSFAKSDVTCWHSANIATLQYNCNTRAYWPKNFQVLYK